jgi:hypothetical protein
MFYKIGPRGYKTSYDNLMIIPKAGCLISTRSAYKDTFTLSIRHPVQNIDRKRRIKSFVNMALGQL